jgi:hypothetical protein
MENETESLVRKSFADYQIDGYVWITLASGAYYPDILAQACELYEPVLVMFKQLLQTSESSVRLLEQIMEQKETWMRIQLLRVFKKYVSPSLPVEMSKVKKKTKDILAQYGEDFRAIPVVQAKFLERPMPDEALCAILWEYKDRGEKGYTLTESFFNLFAETFPNLIAKGPKRAGRDILMKEIFFDYPNPNRPVDFMITDNTGEILAIGLARYDSDRGGAQEDDRIGGYRDFANEISTYAKNHNLKTKVIFLNDGPGLLLGSMWRDYASLEERSDGRVQVITLRMLAERITEEWLNS